MDSEDYIPDSEPPTALECVARVEKLPPRQLSIRIITANKDDRDDTNNNDNSVINQ